MYTKTQERVEIIECGLFERCILGIETAKTLIFDTNFRPIHEDYRSLPNDADLKRKFKICKMDVNFI